MLIDIVTHCYAGRLPLYAELLRLQLQSLIYHAPQECERRVDNGSKSELGCPFGSHA